MRAVGAEEGGCAAEQVCAGHYLLVDVNQFTGAVAFVTADHGAGRPVQPGQAVEAVRDRADEASAAASSNAGPCGAVWLFADIH